MSAMQSKLTRRALLRGIGVTVALPWLEAFPLVAACYLCNSTTDKMMGTPFRLLGSVQ